MLYDFYEILGRGIVAARTGRYKEAIKYLDLAAKIEPSNPRVWLWLATASETVEAKRGHLQAALQADPNSLAASILLNRLNQTEDESHGKPTQSVIFACPYCGGKQRFDPDLSGMHCEHCGKVESLTLNNAVEREIHLTTELQKESGNWAFVEARSTCDACGAKTSHPPSQVTIKCPFCDSDMVTAQSATPNLVSPTGIAPFQYHRDDILEIVAKQWNLQTQKLSRLINNNEVTLSSIYLPFWTFDGTVQIRCALGYRVPPIVYSPEERVILKGREFAEKSWFECEVDDLLVYAAQSVPHNSIASIFPFDLKSICTYRPEVLAGWQAENYQMALADASIEAHKLMRDVAFKRATRRNLFMRTSELIQDDVQVFDKTYKLILLPVWIVRRKNADASSRILINGQSGKTSAHKPGWLSAFKNFLK
ncbi:MAG: hypothetical protein IT310_13430 [Anaerolineales bacterium]|nr:hypothetical protein [Anaerolineales bacterium]